MSLGPGSTLGPFKIQSLIGKGGMGEVFSARDTRLNRDVAVKVLPGDFASDPDRLRRFEGEAKTLAALNHPNILTIFDTGIHESSPYLISELLEGRTLREELSRGPLPLRRATDYALQAANGLAAAHGQGIIHRDLKPENIFLTRDGRLKILDFGLAKPGHILNERRGPDTDPAGPTVIQSTVSGAFLGTPGYMSPEQVRGEPADQRSDIFALGCVVYEMLTGALAFRRDTAVECMNAVLKAEPIDLTTVNSSVSPALERLVRRCLEKEPDKRWQTARDLSFALEVASNAPQRNGEPQFSSPRHAGHVPLLIACGLVAFA